MYDHGHKKHADQSKESSATATADRRNADRHSFTASAEVIELGSGARFSTRTTDLGPGGCFVDTMVPFPVGSKVRVTVRKGQSNFETTGVVVYSQTGLGMGIAFDTMEPGQRHALDSWLAELTGTKQAATPAPASYGAYESVSGKSQSTATVTRLVKLMISKGLLTEAEGASILFDPVL
jgi:hypothetical protein